MRIGFAAEQLDHHPDVDLRWRTLHLTLVSHSAGGVSELDLDLARRIDALLPRLAQAPSAEIPAHGAVADRDPAQVPITPPSFLVMTTVAERGVVIPSSRGQVLPPLSPGCCRLTNSARRSGV